MRALDATTHAILETRRFDARVATRGTRDPLDQLGARINVMLGQIEALVARHARSASTTSRTICGRR